jgi:hypothetical protein
MSHYYVIYFLFLFINRISASSAACPSLAAMDYLTLMHCIWCFDYYLFCSLKFLFLLQKMLPFICFIFQVFSFFFFFNNYFFFFFKRRNIIKSIKVHLNIQGKYTKRTATQKKKEERTKIELTKPKNRTKAKHPNRNQPTKPREQYITARALLPLPG